MKLFVDVATIGEPFTTNRSFVVIYAVGTFGLIGVVGLGMDAAIKLRRISSGAVRAAKRFLLVALLWSVVSLALPYMIWGIPDDTREAMFIQTFKGFLGTVIPFAIWFTYFNVSQRVKATYVD
jgi:hypothetical protein